MPKRRKNCLSRHQKNGAITILAAICLVVVMVFLVFSLDWGYVTVTESELQNAADAAALSGARALPKGRDAAISAAKIWASRNKAAGQPVDTRATEDVQIGLWDDKTASFTALPLESSKTPNAVQVICRRDQSRGNALNLFFAPIFGTRSIDLSATATAAIYRDRCGTIVGLDYVDVRNGRIDSYDSESGAYSEQVPRENGNVCSNGPITIGSEGFVHGDALPGKGYSVDRPNQVSGRTTPRRTQIHWKPVDTTGVQTNNQNSLIPSHLLNNGRLTLTGARNLTLEPGTYYFPAGIQMSGTSSITVLGPTRIVIAGDSKFAGTGIANATQLAANLRIDITSGTATFAGNTALYADIYGPTADLTIDGNAGFFGAILGKSLALSGSASEIHGDEALRRDFDETTRSRLKE